MIPVGQMPGVATPLGGVHGGLRTIPQELRGGVAKLPGRRYCRQAQCAGRNAAQETATSLPARLPEQNRLEAKPVERLSPRSLSFRSLKRLQEVASAGLPLVERAAASAVAAGQYCGGQVASAGLPLVNRAAASAFAAGQYCGERAATVAQAAASRISVPTLGGPGVSTQSSEKVPGTESTPTQFRTPEERGVQGVAESEQNLLQRVASTTSGVISLTSSYCGPLLQQLPFRRTGHSGSAVQDAVEEEIEGAVAALTAHFPHPVLELIKARLRDGSQPGRRRDNAVLALVVEGGGMRGAVSAGGLQALHDLQMREVFDVVYGSSAGAMNATYFLSGQRQGVDIYHEDIANNTFVDLRRLLPRRDGAPQRPALDLNFLLDHVMELVKPLDWNAVLHSPIPLRVVASCVDTCQPIVLANFEDANDLKMSLRGSANVPEVAGAYVLHRGRRLVDAAVFEPVPFRAAIAEGCTHVLTLCSRPVSTHLVARVVDDVISAIVKTAVMSPDHMKPLWRREGEFAAAFGMTPDEMVLHALKEGHHELSVFAGTHMFPIIPGPNASYSPVCIDVPTIRAGITAGREAVMHVFEPMVKEARQATARARPAPRPRISSNVVPLPGNVFTSKTAQPGETA